MLLLLFCLLSLKGYSQFGIRAGANFASINQDPKLDLELKSNPGYHLGILYEIDFGDNFSWRPGLQYSLKGSKIKSATSGNENVLKTGYLEMPLDFVLKFGAPETSRFGIFAGPYLGLLMSSDLDDQDVKDTYKDLDLGLNAGIQFEFLPVTLGLQYGAGLNNVANNNGTTGDITVKNQSVSAFVIFTL